MKSFTTRVVLLAGAVGNSRTLAPPAVAALTALACVPIPHRVATLHEIELTFRSDSEAKADVAVTNVRGDAGCSQAIRKTEIRNGETKVVPGQSEEKLWRFLFPHDPLSGFRLCIEQDGRRFLGAEYFHLGYSDARVKVDCKVSSETARTADGSTAGAPNASTDVCTVGPTSTADR